MNKFLVLIFASIAVLNLVQGRALSKSVTDCLTKLEPVAKPYYRCVKAAVAENPGLPCLTCTYVYKVCGTAEAFSAGKVQEDYSLKVCRDSGFDDLNSEQTAEIEKIVVGWATEVEKRIEENEDAYNAYNLDYINTS